MGSIHYLKRAPRIPVDDYASGYRDGYEAGREHARRDAASLWFSVGVFAGMVLASIVTFVAVVVSP